MKLVLDFPGAVALTIHQRGVTLVRDIIGELGAVGPDRDLPARQDPVIGHHPVHAVIRVPIGRGGEVYTRLTLARPNFGGLGKARKHARNAARSVERFPRNA